MKITLPLRLVSEANAHEHWRNRQRRAKLQRLAAKLAVQNARHGRPMPSETERFEIGLTVIHPRMFDSDNLQSSCKHVRDGVADALGIDDRSARMTWLYAQRRGKPKEHAVEVTIRELE